MKDIKTEIKIDLKELQTPLTPLQHRFVIEYLKDGNASRACKEAGYKGKSYRMMGYANLQNPNIAKAIKEAQGIAIQRASLDRDNMIDYFLKTAEEARDSGKFDAAVRAYEKISEIIGILNVKKEALSKTEQKKAEEEKENAINRSPSKVFAMSDGEGKGLEMDITSFLRTALNKSSAAQAPANPLAKERRHNDLGSNEENKKD
jgi:phage terminase small subunit